MRGGCKPYAVGFRSAPPGGAPPSNTFRLPPGYPLILLARNQGANLFPDSWVEKKHSHTICWNCFKNGKGIMTSMGKKTQFQEPDGFSPSTTGNGSRPPPLEDEQGTRRQMNRASAT